MRTPSILLTWVVTCLWLSATNAQAHKVRFVAFDLPVSAGACKLIPAADEKNTTSADVGISRFSKVINMPPGLYRLVLPDGKTTGRLNLDGEATQARIAIVLPGPEGTVTILTVSDETSTFGAGDRLFINATISDIRVQIGDRNLTCKPGTTQMIKPPGQSKEGRFPVRMGYLKDDEWLIFNSTWWPDDRACRSLVLLYPNTTTGAPGVKTIEEIPSQAK